MTTNQKPRLTTRAACRVAGLHPDRLNEYIAGDIYNCAPHTSQGRGRIFFAEDILGLWLFRDLMDCGTSPKHAAAIACKVSGRAKEDPDAKIISYVRLVVGSSLALPADQVPALERWGSTTFSGSEILEVRHFHVALIRRRIMEMIEEEQATIGEPD